MRGEANMSRNLEKSSQDNSARLEDELELLLLEQQMQQQQRARNLYVEQERDINMCRSGSAPPTVEGAMNAVGSLFRVSNLSQLNESGSGSVTNGGMTEEEIRSHPAYLAYYYSNENNNPRLPQPLLSREDWRLAQRMGSSFGGREDWRNNNVADYGGSSSLFSNHPVHKVDDELILLRKAAANNILRNSSPDLLDQSMIGMSGADLGLRRKSFADIVQEGSAHQALAGHISRPSSRNSVQDNVVTDADLSELQARASTSDVLHPGKSVPGSLSSVQNSSPDSFASAMNLPSTNNSILDPHQGSSSVNGFSSGKTEIADVAASLAALNMPNNQFHGKDNHLHSQPPHPQFRMGVPNAYLDRSRSEAANYAALVKDNSLVPPSINSSFDGRQSLPRKAYSSANIQSHVDHPGLASIEDQNSYNLHNNNPAAGLALQSALINAQMKRNAGHADFDIHPALLDPHHVQQLHESYNQHMNTGSGHGNPSRIRNHHGLQDLHDMEMMYLETLLLQQKRQYQSPMYSSSGLHHPHHTDLGFNTYQGNHMGRSLHPAVGTGTSMYDNKRIPLETSSSKKSGSARSGNSKSETSTEGPASTLLEVLKNNSRSLELSDVMGHVKEFSMDQYGSRFIQQKLETATDEEKIKIFSEIMPCGRSLMADVFGNYVIQKFFEHGTESQRKELGSQLTGHVLPLTLQMYGCRVIQKALEVVDVEQQTLMVAELDGSVMKCVRDQNGNHVIQKCIEFVPPDRIQFIISSFFGEVVSLSMHPYGCRVIQRVLEHCKDPETQNLIMDEIMQSICNLAQDQYGNYVIQHVLQHGKPHERSAIISKLAGQIVKMSQQKFASNVVEKCLTFGSPDERQILVDEMLGSTDENEPLQAMMKDPFGNYVVQKILETCDNDSRELILSRIKVHLNALKKYTYGKHIVSRVEKLITAGERHRDKES